MTRSRSEMARRLYILTAPRGARSLVQSAVILTTQNADWTLGVTPGYWHDARATGDLGGDTISHRQLPKGQAKQPHNDSRTRARISTTLTWGLGLPEARALVWVLLAVQYIRLLARIVNGDLARTLQPEAVLSGKIGFLAAVIAIALGVGIGMTSARKANTSTDRILISLALAVYSVPNFVWAFLLVFVGVTVLFNLTARLIFYYPTPRSQPLPIILPAFPLTIPFTRY